MPPQSHHAPEPHSPTAGGGAPRTSILLCLYDGETFVSRTIASALRQTSADFELLIIDDGSTDGSLDIVKRVHQDQRLRVIRQENRGTAGAIQTGLEVARGEYVAFLDQDDLWEPDYLASQIELLDARPEIALSFTRFRIIDEAGRDTGLTSRRISGTLDFQSLLTDFVIGGNSNVVARRSAIEAAGGVDLEFRLLYNVDLCLRIALLSPHNIGAVPRLLMSYRRHAGQMSRDLNGLIREWDRAIRKFERLAPELVAGVRRAAQSNELRYFARVAYEHERYAQALGFLARGFSATPGTFLRDGRNWLTFAACLSGLLFPQRLHFALERLAGFRRSTPMRG
jgi:glycosyltransferase involved in cell wall biosynthesis